MDLYAFTLAAATYLAPAREHEAFARAVETAVDESPSLFGDDPEKLRTAALVVAVAYRESGFRLDAVGDHGRSVCAMQIHLGKRELLRDGAACIREGLRRLRASLKTCRAHPIAAYAEGPRGCSSARAQRVSADRVAIARRALAHVLTENRAPKPTQPDLSKS